MTTDNESLHTLIETEHNVATERAERAARSPPQISPSGVPPGVPSLPAAAGPASAEGTLARGAEAHAAVAANLRNLQPVTETSPAVVQAVAAAVTQARAEIPAGRSATVRQAIPALRNAPAPQPRIPEGELRAGNLVGGAAAAGNGVIVGWDGSGPMTRDTQLAALSVASMPESWAASTKSAHAYAGQAVKLLDAQGMVTRADRGTVRRNLATGETSRTYRARWNVGSVADVAGTVGGSFGCTVLTVTLPPVGDVLQFDGDPRLAARVREAYDKARGGETYQAGEVTAWLKELIQAKFRAVKLGGVWYVPHRYVADAERLCTALARSWGVAWILPALPIATSAQLYTGIRNGISDEVRAIEIALAEAREERRAKKHAEITGQKAASLLVDLGNVAERLTHYSVLLGPTHTAPVKARIDALRSVLDVLADGASQRYEQIAEEMGWREGLS